MSDLSTVPGTHEAVEKLLSIQDDESLETALAAADPGIVARAVCGAPTLEQKTNILWALDDRERRRALDLIPAALVGALVQNLEDDNRYLLGDLSLEQFRQLLSLCSPERKYYWISTALSFTDARANALPLLLATRELVEILMTRAEFEEHIKAIADYPIEDQRIPVEMLTDPAQAIVDLLGADNLLRLFPVQEHTLAQVLQTILDYDPDRYVDLLREGLRETDYTENHPLEWETLAQEPIILDALDPVQPYVPSGDRDDLSIAEGPPLALVAVGAAPLVRLEGMLLPAQAQRVASELQYLYIREAIAHGGSFLRTDLERAARSVEAYLLLGVQAEGGGSFDREAEALANRPLNKLTQSGARVVERLRQVALRIRPLEQVLSPVQRALIRSLVSPRLTIGADGGPLIMLLPAGDLPDHADVATATALLHEVGAWTGLARGLGLERTAEALHRAGGVERLQEELALGAVLFGRIELGLADPADDRRFQAQYLSPVAREVLPEARVGLRRALESWGRAEVDLAAPVLEAALERVAARAR